MSKLSFIDFKSLNWQRCCNILVVFIFIFKYTEKHFNKLITLGSYRLWTYSKKRWMVGPSADNIYSPFIFYRVCNLGGFSGRALCFWSIPLPVLLTRDLWRFTSQLVWPEAIMVAVDLTFLTCHSHSLGARWFSVYLLLLSRSLL